MLSIFDQETAAPPEHHARLSDPEPSHQAPVEYLGESGLRVLATLIEVERVNRHRPGATAPEIRQQMDDGPALDRNCISRRLTTLRRMGFVVELPVKRDGGHGVSVTVYSATAEGRESARG